jgi:hypothetical protein
LGSSLSNQILSVLAANVQRAPRKLTPFHQYLKGYYQTHIKDEYDRRYAIAKNNYDSLTKEEKENGDVKEPVPVLLRSEIGKEFWLLETDEFREKVAKDAEDAHMRELEEWEASKVIPKTPQQFHQ